MDYNEGSEREFRSVEVEVQQEKMLTKLLSSCINFLWCHSCLSEQQIYLKNFSCVEEQLQIPSCKKQISISIASHYLGTEARKRSASLTYPSTSKNISLIFFFA